MATKPTIALARWADLGGSFVTDPSSGERDAGFQDATPAEADKVNALIKQLYLWALYLNDGALSGNHSIAGTLATTGALTVGAAAIITGALTIGGQPLVFADFTYTADAGTDTLTKTAHGLETGDGAARTTNSGGGLPGGLAINTDYFVIRTGANTFKLATSRANALAGTAIDITSAGTGTHTLIDQAGTTRVTDATVTRDLVVGGRVTASEYFHGDATLAISPFSGTVVTDSNWTPLVNPARRSATTASSLFVPINLRVGDRIKSVSYKLFGNGTADVTVSVLHVDASMVETQIGVLVTNNQAASWSTITIDVTDTLLVANSALSIVFAANASGIEVGNISATYDHPLL